jgi:threonine/homoserine/homoserine lactone efflux protein
MTITPAEIGFYALGIFLLFLTPGPVWVALTARALSGGFRAAWPLAVGVTLGDLLWPFLAILGMSWVLSTFDGVMAVMRWVACATFLFMGATIIRNADKTIGTDSRLTRPGMLAGFLAGVAVIIGNPKAILFYMGMLPGFFDIRSLTPIDIAIICAISMAIPLAGNLALAWFIGRARDLLTSPAALRRTNLVAGVLLIAVGLVIPFT